MINLPVLISMGNFVRIFKTEARETQRYCIAIVNKCMRAQDKKYPIYRRISFNWPWTWTRNTRLPGKGKLIYPTFLGKVKS